MHLQELSQAQEEDVCVLEEHFSLQLSHLQLGRVDMTTEDCAGGNLTDVLSMVRNTQCCQ